MTSLPERVLIIHNHYDRPGGEDMVVEAEERMLSSRGHDVRTLISSNAGLPRAGVGKKLGVGLRTVWDLHSYGVARRLIAEFRPAVVHCHNTFPTPSPSVYHAAHAEGVPVVQTLHNYRTFCLNALLFRDGRACSICLGRLPWRGVLYRCYRGSTAASAAVASMLAWHQSTGTWRRLVARYIALTMESRRMMTLAGIPEARIAVKPNFISPDPGVGDHAGKFVLFVGRLSPDKGIETLLEAWETHNLPIPLRIAGDGPIRELVVRFAVRHPDVTYLGQLPPGEVRKLMCDATLLVFPSIAAEGMPLVILESFAAGLPVLASEHQNLIEIVGGADAGWFFPPGDAGALSGRVEAIWRVPSEVESRGRAARAAYEAHYMEADNYRQLIGVYESAATGRPVTA